jgi:hypothetical protein
MKRLLITALLFVFGISYAAAQHSGTIDKPLTQEQRMVQSNAKHRNSGRSADVSKKVHRAKKQDRSARKMKSKNKKKPKR